MHRLWREAERRRRAAPYVRVGRALSVPPPTDSNILVDAGTGAVLERDPQVGKPTLAPNDAPSRTTP